MCEEARFISAGERARESCKGDQGSGETQEGRGGWRWCSFESYIRWVQEDGKTQRGRCGWGARFCEPRFKREGLICKQGACQRGPAHFARAGNPFPESRCSAHGFSASSSSRANLASCAVGEATAAAGAAPARQGRMGVQIEQNARARLCTEGRERPTKETSEASLCVHHASWLHQPHTCRRVAQAAAGARAVSQRRGRRGGRRRGSARRGGGRGRVVADVICLDELGRALGAARALPAAVARHGGAPAGE